ncbi:MAG: tetratricopeptide repeat protein [Phycisphaerales bacterium]|nr:tetratricopeptide repeat protein [Phycisphaerales bacterium]
MAQSPGVVELPQLRTGGKIKHSRRGRQRAVVLILIHIVIVAHFMQWYIQGRTITPVEPSEAMQTLEQGKINAGFVLFAAAILATLIFGRFFCGWACHIVAVQDLATWMLKKAGIRPKPFRSRLLILVPLVAAIYMFVWPSVARLILGADPPDWVAHFTTSSFWKTFPGPFISVLTLIVCGPLIVYLLGNKGFCTYACPYGGFFGPADSLAPLRIRVNDACDGRGHCTGVCTSNVRVHEEVRNYRAVVHPGCMKCLDCVDVCPNNALSVGWGKPAVAISRRGAARSKPEYDFSWAEEIAMAAIFLCCLYIFRGLYEAIPFLLSLGLSGVCAFLFITLARMAYVRNIRLHQFQLRRNGRIAPAGATFLGFMAMLVAFLTHSTVVQFATHEGARLLEKTERAYQASQRAGSGAIDEMARQSAAYLEFARRIGFFSSANLEAKIGFLHSYLGNHAQAEWHLREAIRLKDDHDGARKALAEMYLAQGQPDSAFDELLAALREAPEARDIAPMLGDLSLKLGRSGAALEVMQAALRHDPHHADVRLSMGMLMAHSGDMQGGLRELRHVVDELPKSARARFSLGIVLAETKDLPGAIAAWEAAVGLDAHFADARVMLGRARLMQREPAAALAQLDEARKLRPAHPETLYWWSQAVAAAGLLEERLRELAGKPDSADDLYALTFLHLARGDEPAARQAFIRAKALNAALIPPFAN